MDIDGLDEVAEQGPLEPEHLPLGEFVRGGHADHLGGGVIKGRRENREHLQQENQFVITQYTTSFWLHT